MKPLIADIQRATAAHYGLEVSDLTGRSREPRFVRPRHAAIYLSRVVTGKGYSAIGRAFKRDHSTIISAERSFRRKLDEPGVLHALSAICERVSA